MNRSRVTPTQLLLALIAALLIALLATMLVHRKNSAPPANIEGLKDSLRKAAEASLPAPTVTNDQIAIAAKDGNAEAMAESVAKQSEALGGTALKSPGEDGSIRLLVRISGSNAARFREIVTGKPAQAGNAAPDGRQFIEVIISK